MLIWGLVKVPIKARFNKKRSNWNKEIKSKKKIFNFPNDFFLPTIQFLQSQTTTLTARGVYFLLSEIKIERFFSSDNDHDDDDDNVVYVEDKLH